MQTEILRKDFSEKESFEAKIVQNGLDYTVELFTNYFGEKRLKIQLSHLGQDLQKRLLETFEVFFSDWHNVSPINQIFLIQEIKVPLNLKIQEKAILVLEKFYANGHAISFDVSNPVVTEDIRVLLNEKHENVQMSIQGNGFSYYPEDGVCSFGEDAELSNVIDLLKKGRTDLIEVESNLQGKDNGLVTTVSASHNDSLFFKMEMLLPPDERMSDFLRHTISCLVMEEYISKNVVK